MFYCMFHNNGVAVSQTNQPKPWFAVGAQPNENADVQE